MTLYKPKVCESCGGDKLWCGCGKSSGLPFLIIGVALLAVWVALPLFVGVF